MAVIVAALSLSFIFSKPAFAANPLINEFLAHPSIGNKEWVEFYNVDQLDLSNYWLDDDLDFTSDSGSSPKKSLSGINISNNTYPYLEFESFLNNGGDYVVLFSSDGSLVDQYHYTTDPGTDVSIGRTPDGNDDFVILASASKSSTNGQALPTPSPSPSPQPSPSPTKPPSPTPSPKPSPTQAPKSPSPTPINESILGELTNSMPSAGPSPSPLPENDTPKSKLALILIGAGLVLVGLSSAFYVWYSKLLGKDPKKNVEDTERSRSKKDDPDLKI